MNSLFNYGVTLAELCKRRPKGNDYVESSRKREKKCMFIFVIPIYSTGVHVEKQPHLQCRTTGASLRVD